MSNKEANNATALPAAYKKPISVEARRVLSLLAGRPVRENDIKREARGRPFLPGLELDFSIAHTGALAAVSLARGGGRTGCDIERIRKRPGAREIAKHFFSVSERNYIFNQDSFDETRFYGIWTLKECFLKLRGLSVFDMAAVPSFISDEGSQGEQLAFGAAVSSALSFRLYELSSGGAERYMLATVIEWAGTEPPQPEIRWFSQASLSCKIIAEIKAAPSPTETVSPKR